MWAIAEHTRVRKEREAVLQCAWAQRFSSPTICFIMFREVHWTSRIFFFGVNGACAFDTVALNFFSSSLVWILSLVNSKKKLLLLVVLFCFEWFLQRLLFIEFVLFFEWFRYKINRFSFTFVFLQTVKQSVVYTKRVHSLNVNNIV